MMFFLRLHFILYSALLILKESYAYLPYSNDRIIGKSPMYKNQLQIISKCNTKTNTRHSTQYNNIKHTSAKSALYMYNSQITSQTHASKEIKRMNKISKHRLCSEQPLKISSGAEIIDLNNSKNDNTRKSPLNNKGPLGFMKNVIMLFVLIIKSVLLKIQLYILKFVIAIKNRFLSLQSKVTSTATDNKKIVMMKKNKKTSKITTNLITLLKQKKFWIRFIGGSFLFIMVKKYVIFSKSLTTELSYSTFLKLLKNTPERINGLKVTPDSFIFRLDGKLAITRIGEWWVAGEWVCLFK